MKITLTNFFLILYIKVKSVEAELEHQFNSLGERTVAGFEYFLFAIVAAATVCTGIPICQSRQITEKCQADKGKSSRCRVRFMLTPMLVRITIKVYLVVLNLCQHAAINCDKVELKNENSWKSCWHLN